MDSEAGRVELLPCPFCSGVDEDLVQAFTRATDDFAYWSVECLKCGCEIGSDTSQAEADGFWNTRPTPDNGLREALEDARAILEHIEPDGTDFDRSVAATLAKVVSALQPNTGERGDG
jgi:hypothetical protein